MLISLHIENIAVIKKADIDFNSGFMVLSGETGAGKSIIIDSIALLLGAKADRELIRHGQTQAMVSGVFTSISKITLDNMALCGVEADEDGNLLIQRTISTDGRSVVKINGRTVTIAALKAFSQGLISIHSQTDTTMLMDSSVHLSLVDTYAGNGELLEKYSLLYDKLDGIRQQIKSIKEKQSESERLREILEYQIKDIDSLKLHDGEEEELVDKKVKIKNSEKITKNADFVYKALKGSEKGAVSYLIDRSITALSQISGVLPGLDEYCSQLRDMKYQIDDIAEEVYAVIDYIDEEPEEALNKIESRLDKISKIKRKYGLTIADVLAFRDNAKAELETLENSEELLKNLDNEEKKAYSDALAVANELHSVRVASSKVLEEKIKATLEMLDMPKVVFFVDIKEEYYDEKKILTRTGSDSVELFISTNLGADPLPLSKVASGGELARVMLAIKSVIADNDGTSTVIFDEIDAGVSGKTARKIGYKMLDLSKQCQIFCITHSAQIASLADTHYLISKSTVGAETETKIETLDYDGRVRELSRILGGINVTDSQRAAAVDMLNNREN